jgi:hypothetical protein
MAKKLVLPRVHAMVLCDDFDWSPDEEEVFHLFGVRSNLAVSAFPYTHEQLVAYLQLTGHPGRTTCEVRIVDPNTDDILLAAPERIIELTGPLNIVPFIFLLEDCVFGGPGLYYVQVHCDGKLVCERSLFILREA